MINQQLLDYIKQQTALGKSKEEIKQALLSQGWREDDIEAGFAAAASGIPAPAASGTPTDLPKASNLFKQSWSLYKKRFWVLMGVYLIPYLTITALMAILGALGIASKNFSFGHSLISTPFAIILVIAVVLVAIYLGVWTEAALIYAIKDSAENISFTEAFKRSSGKIWKLLGVNLLAGLAIMGGLILLIIPGLVFAVWFSQSSYIAVLEDIGGTAALSRSKQYVKGRFWAITGKLAYILVISILLSIILGIIGSILFGSGDSALKTILNNIFNVLWAPLAAIYAYLLYQGIKSTAK